MTSNLICELRPVEGISFVCFQTVTREIKLDKELSTTIIIIILQLLFFFFYN